MSENLVPELCRTKEQIEGVAHEDGLICFFPNNYELTLDIDKPFQTYTPDAEVQRVIDVLKKNHIDITSRVVTRSVSGNMHVWLRLSRPMDAASRIALQALMGSDPVREALSLLRLQAMSEAPIALFETYGGANMVESWRAANAEIKAEEDFDLGI